MTPHEQRVEFLRLAGAWDTRPLTPVIGTLAGVVHAVTPDEWVALHEKQALLDSLNRTMRARSKTR